MVVGEWTGVDDTRSERLRPGWTGGTTCVTRLVPHSLSWVGPGTRYLQRVCYHYYPW